MNLKKKKVSVAKFFQMFPNNETARQQFEQWRWGNTKRCPHCDSVRIAESNQKMPYRCKDCRKRFSVRTNTVMAASNLGFQTWMYAVFVATVGIKGTSSTKLASDTDTTQKTGWFLGQRIRKALETDIRMMTGAVEVDESYFGGKEANKHKSKRLKQGRGTVGKIAIVGMKCRKTGRIKTKVVPATTQKELHEFIMTSVDYGTTIYTDDHRSYLGLPHPHYTVRHSAGEYVKGQAHINGMESHWALLKRAYHGTHHHLSLKHIHRYSDEFSSRHSLRKLDTFDAMRLVALGMIGKELKYKDLIK